MGWGCEEERGLHALEECVCGVCVCACEKGGGSVVEDGDGGAREAPVSLRVYVKRQTHTLLYSVHMSTHCLGCHRYTHTHIARARITQRCRVRGVRVRSYLQVRLSVSVCVCVSVSVCACVSQSGAHL